MALLERFEPRTGFPVGFSPFSDLLGMQREINRMFGDFLGRTPGRTLSETVWTPPLDIFETADELVVRAELPGMRREDIEVNVEGNTLILRGERKFEAEEDKESYHRVERVYGAFRRVLDLPATVDPDRVEATYRDGILEIHLGKREEAKPRQIEVKVA